RSDDSRKNENENRKNLEESGEDRPSPRFRNISRRKDALHYVLIGTPIPNAEDWRSEHYSGPWKIRVVRRLPHREKVRRHFRLKSRPAAHRVETDEHQRH